MDSSKGLRAQLGGGGVKKNLQLVLCVWGAEGSCWGMQTMLFAFSLVQNERGLWRREKDSLNHQIN